MSKYRQISIMTDPKQEPTPQSQKSITTIQIAFGVAGGLLLFFVGGNLIREVIDDSEGGAYKSQIQDIEKLREETEQLVRKENARRMDCTQFPCATVTGENLVKWPLSVPAPVIATCDLGSKFIQADGQWYERSDKPDSYLPSWLAIQKVDGIWPFQHRLSLEFLNEEIEKVCRK
jgi:hypothetical protein